MVEIEIVGVSERDIDLLLVEEFVASPEFLVWFLEHLHLPRSASLVACARSVAAADGESDVELLVRTAEAKYKILIENKVDAGFQPRQPERYLERATGYVQTTLCDRALTVIIAPDQYFGSSSETFGFDYRVTYESLLQWFQSSHLGDRRQYKDALLRAAITRSADGWQLVRNETTTEFWQRYWQLSVAVASELRMPKPSVKPTRAEFIRFAPTGLTRGVGLIHKLKFGNVDLQFAGMGEKLSQVEHQYSSYLEAGMHIEQAAKSAVIRLVVPRIDITAPFEESESVARQGLSAASELLRLYRRVHDRAQANSA